MHFDLEIRKLMHFGEDCAQCCFYDTKRLALEQLASKMLAHNKSKASAIPDHSLEPHPYFCGDILERVIHAVGRRQERCLEFGPSLLQAESYTFLLGKLRKCSGFAPGLFQFILQLAHQLTELMVAKACKTGAGGPPCAVGWRKFAKGKRLRGLAA
jgi:hypothetical protein